MKDKLTRRQLAGVILTATAAAQTAPSIPSNPAAELEAVHDRNHAAGEALAKVSLPVDTEPAFHFTA
jgi:hypothetical protein